MKYSIIIPTVDVHNLQTCYESISKYTDLDDVEIIVIINSPNNSVTTTVAKCFLFDKMIGYPKAVNVGLKAATGDYVVLMNDDTILLQQNKNDWLNMLREPFDFNPNCGITGPILKRCDEVGRNFLIFFCIMISRKCLVEIPLLDETFSPGGCEDIDYCIRAQDKGFDIVQVPYKRDIVSDSKQMVGAFPIWHAAEQTVKNLENWTKIFQTNMDEIVKRYKTDKGLI